MKEKGEGRRAKGEGRKEKGERRREKGERRKEKLCPSPFPFRHIHVRFGESRTSQKRLPLTASRQPLTAEKQAVSSIRIQGQ